MRTAGYFFVVIVFCIALSGCSKVNVNDSSIFDNYYLTNLKQSSSADLIGAISTSGNELMSQSESVIASWTEEKKGYVYWFNMVAFDEDDLRAVRKYCLVVDEKARRDVFLKAQVQKARLEISMVVDDTILGDAYSNENERRIAVIKEAVSKFGADSAQVTADSMVLNSSTMLAKQTLNGILYRLRMSPALAERLDDYSGMSFDHMTLGPGKIRMLIEDDIVKIKIKIGSNTKSFDQHLDVIGM